MQIQHKSIFSTQKQSLWQHKEENTTFSTRIYGKNEQSESLKQSENSQNLLNTPSNLNKTLSNLKNLRGKRRFLCRKHCLIALRQFSHRVENKISW